MADDEGVPALLGDGEQVVTSGWFRNTGHVVLTVQPDNYPSARLEPDAATWLPADPHHPDLTACDEPPPAADTVTES